MSDKRQKNQLVLAFTEVSLPAVFPLADFFHQLLVTSLPRLIRPLLTSAAGSE